MWLPLESLLSTKAIMLADNDVVKETNTTTERPTIEEKRTSIKTTTETKYYLSQHKVQQSAGNGSAGLSS
jgi:hypothetical protein